MLSDWALPGLPEDSFVWGIHAAQNSEASILSSCSHILSAKEVLLLKPRQLVFSPFLPQLLNACQTYDIPFSRGEKIIAGSMQTNSQNTYLSCPCVGGPSDGALLTVITAARQRAVN